MSAIQSNLVRRQGDGAKGHVYTHSRTLHIQTQEHPTKGWSWRIMYRDEVVARGAHHVPFEAIAIGRACDAFGDVLRKVLMAEGSPDEIRRADEWQEHNDRLAADHGKRDGPKPSNKVPVRLTCGHIRTVRPPCHWNPAQRVNCGVCLTHVGIAEVLT